MTQIATNWLHKHIKVLDASALTALFKSEKSTSAESLFLKLKAEHLRGGVAIADQVFFEMTGLLPSSLEDTKQRLEEAQADNRLEEEVRLMAQQSPLQGPNYKNEIQALLLFYAHYPDAVCATQTGQTFSNYCYTQLADAPQSEQMLSQLVLTKGEVRELLGDTQKPEKERLFKQEDLRVHISDLVQMGYMHRQDYKKRSENASQQPRKKRFITVNDFKALIRTENQETKALAENTLSAIERRFDTEQHSEYGGKAGQHYLQYRHLNMTMDSGSKPLLPVRYAKRHSFAEKAKERIQVDELTQHTELLMEHCFFGGLLPLEQLEDIAQLLGFSAKEAEESAEAYRSRLADKEGFFERRVSVADLKKIAQFYPSDILQRLSDASAITALRQQTLRNSTDNWSSASQSDGQFDIKKGAAYEDAFYVALMHKRLSPEQFIKLAQESGALPNTNDYHALTGNYHSGLWVSDDLEHLYIRCKGFISRSGTHRLQLENEIESIDGTDCFCVSMYELLAHARGDSDKQPDLTRNADRILRGLLYPAVESDSAAFRKHATRLLDGNQPAPQSQLLQIEHDWIRRHKNKWGGRDAASKDSGQRHEGNNFPFFTSFFASLFAQRENARSSLGEIACCELANQTLIQTKQSAVIIRHDKSIETATDDLKRFDGFSEVVKRYHAELRRDIEDIEQSLKDFSTQERLMVVASKEWVKQLSPPTTQVTSAQSQTPQTQELTFTKPF